MARLIVIIGSTGAGKSYIFQNIEKINQKLIPNYNPLTSKGKYVPICKYTTRSSRANEEVTIDSITGQKKTLDLIFEATPEQFLECGKFIYPYGEYYYGVPYKEIDKELSKGNNPVVIIRDLIVLEAMKARYQLVIDIYVSSSDSEGQLEQRLTKSGNNDAEKRIRMNNLQHDKNQLYYSNSKFYRIVRNYYDESFLDEIITILKKSPDIIQNQFALIAANQERIDAMKRIVTREYDFSNKQVLGFEYDFCIQNESLEEYNKRILAIRERILESQYVFIDITTNENESKSGLYRLLSFVEINKNSKDFYIFANENNFEFIPFDIHNHNIIQYDDDGGISNEIRKRIAIMTQME